MPQEPGREPPPKGAVVLARRSKSGAELPQALRPQQEGSGVVAPLEHSVARVELQPQTPEVEDSRPAAWAI